MKNNKNSSVDSSKIKKEMEELEMNRIVLSRLMYDCKDQIYKLQRKCPHANVVKGEPYDQECQASEDEIVTMKERDVTCTDCGHFWEEQVAWADDFDDETADYGGGI